MRMFDGSDEDRGEGPDVDADAEARVDVPAPAGPVETEDSPAPAGKKSRKKNKKNKKNKKRHDEDSDTAYQSLPSKDARNGDDLDAIFGAIDRPGADIGADSDEEKPRHPTSEGKRRRKSWTTPSQGIDNALEAQMREEERLRRKIERKRFMSSNPDSMLSFDEKAMLLEAKRRAEKSQASGWVDKKTEMEEFKAIRREIQSFGMLFVSCCHPAATGADCPAAERSSTHRTGCGCIHYERDGSCYIKQYHTGPRVRESFSCAISDPTSNSNTSAHSTARRHVSPFALPPMPLTSLSHLDLFINLQERRGLIKSRVPSLNRIVCWSWVRGRRRGCGCRPKLAWGLPRRQRGGNRDRSMRPLHRVWCHARQSRRRSDGP